MRPRPDERHLPEDHIHELREFIQRPAAQEFSHARHARIILYFKERTIATMIELREIRLLAIGILVHRTEFHNADAPAAVLSNARGDIEDRPTGIDDNCDRNEEKNGKKNDEQHQRPCKIEQALKDA